MRYVLLLFSLLMFACKHRTIESINISYHNIHGSLNSSMITDKKEIQIFENALYNKIEYTDKWSRKFYLNIKYSNGDSEEYEGNGAALRINHVYYFVNKDFQKSYLETINAHLPSYLKQEEGDSSIATQKNNDSLTTLVIPQKEEQLYDLIEKIPEVKKLNTKSNQRLSIMISQRPDKTFHYYWLQAGINDDIRFTPVYNFFIEEKTLEVKYYDTLKDSVISLKDWRSNRGW